MNKEVPKELVKFHSQDYEVDGLDILKTIRNRSKEFNILVSEKLEEMNLLDYEIRSIEEELPIFDELVFKVIYYASERNVLNEINKEMGYIIEAISQRNSKENPKLI